ncbi:MAG: SGNH/GDSL hydrolase family protein [Anaerostipes caccae]|uniref:SGNH/GDSL hydrolase family protein n=1 Tax=Anaerostipes caccae TaxID=105841 RepID=UPI00399519DF
MKKKVKIIASMFLSLVLITCFIPKHNLHAKSKPTIYIMGDSIAHSYEGNRYQNGWGQMLYRYFKHPSKKRTVHVKGASDYVDVIRYNTPELSIENWAKNGASVAIYDKYGMFQAIQKKLKKGDYVFIQLGHNEVYTQWWTGSTVSEYRTYLINYIKKIRSKKAKPVLITPPPVNTSGKYIPYVPQYRAAMISIGKKYKVPLIDLGKKSADYFNLIGKKQARNMYVKDNMHFTPKGATTLAKILSVEIKYKSQLNPISGKVSLRTNSLYKTINKASKLKSKKYNKKTWKYMQKKLKTSKKLLYSITPKQKSIDKSNASLKKAIKKLKKSKKYK